MKKKKRKPRKRKFILGGKHGRLTVVSLWEENSNGDLYLCKCSCGCYAIARKASLLSGNTKSCGCLQIEMAERIIDKAHERQTEVMGLIEDRRVSWIKNQNL